jgi:nucleoside-diphosphate-sugar epimerase
MNVLITGATGFIGRALVRRLVRGNNKVTALVRNQRKTDASFLAGCTVHVADIIDKDRLAALVPLIGSMDVMIHLAACIDYQADKEALFQTNVEGTVNVLESARKLGVAKFVYISSIEAIGPISGKEVPADETQPCRPVNSYGESKLEAENRVLRAGVELNMDVAVLRLGNVYGPESLSFVLPVAGTVLAANKSWLYSNWHLYRWNPVYIDDAVAGIMSASVAKGRGGIYIISGGEPTTLGRLAEVIARELGVDCGTRGAAGWAGVYMRALGMRTMFKAWLRSFQYPRVNWVYSIEKARRELGYAPQVRLEDGVHRTMEWAKKEGILQK